MSWGLLPARLNPPRITAREPASRFRPRGVRSARSIPGIVCPMVKVDDVHLAKFATVTGGGLVEEGCSFSRLEVADLPSTTPIYVVWRGTWIGPEKKLDLGVEVTAPDDSYTYRSDVAVRPSDLAADGPASLGEGECFWFVLNLPVPLQVAGETTARFYVNDDLARTFHFEVVVEA